MTAQSAASDNGHVKAESDSSFEGPKPTHYLARDREQFTPLIPLDELPEWITIPGLDIYVTASELLTLRGTACFPIAPKGNDPYHVVVDKEEPRAPSPVSTLRSRVEAVEESLNVPSNATLKARILRNINDTDLGRSSSAGGKTHQRYNPTTPGVLGTKVYCTHWMRTGECDFTQQGCMFVHCMPDLPTLELLGFRCYPRWFREMPREFQEVNAKEFRIEGLTTPSRSQPNWKIDTSWRSGRNDSEAQGGFRNFNHGPQSGGPQGQGGHFHGHGPGHNNGQNCQYPQGPGPFGPNQFYPQGGFQQNHQPGFQNFHHQQSGFGQGNQGLGNARFSGQNNHNGLAPHNIYGPGWATTFNNAPQAPTPAQTNTPVMTRESSGAPGMPTPPSSNAVHDGKKPVITILQRKDILSGQAVGTGSVKTHLSEHPALTPILQEISLDAGTIGDKQKTPAAPVDESQRSSPVFFHPKRFQNPRFIPTAKFQAPDISAYVAKEKEAKEAAKKHSARPVAHKEHSKHRTTLASHQKSSKPFRGSQDIRKTEGGLRGSQNIVKGQVLTVENVGKMVRETREKELREQLAKAKVAAAEKALLDLDSVTGEGA